MNNELLKKFLDNDICMWNANTNYLTYLNHFKKILKYCFDNKINEITYNKWLSLLNTSKENCKIGAETHNICNALNIIESTYVYNKSDKNDYNVFITIPRDLIYQFYVDNMDIGDECWNIIQKRYFDFLNNNNIFSLNEKKHIQRVCLNMYICYLLDTKQYSVDDIKEYIKFAKDTGDNIAEKINKVYKFDICNPNSNILQKLRICYDGNPLENCEIFKAAIMSSVHEKIEKNKLPNEKKKLDEKKLGEILKKYYELDSWNKNTGIMLFGIRYGDYIENYNLSRSEIISYSNIGKSYSAELDKAISLKDYVSCLPKANLNDNLFNIDRVKQASNIIFYGTPGCGKSFKVSELFNEEEYSVFRTTFHPEYSNSDFVGQIIPKTENNEIKYEFQEGPFTLALYDAIINPFKKVCLIIEEINRGNASAIFGDIFQLLDRDADGNSVYNINNEQIKYYLSKNGVNIDKINIPSNLWIVATMNTSDQNVFTLDTAFKRRWRMKRICNEFNKETNEYDKKLAEMYIPGSSYTWEQFITIINQEIMKKNPTGINSEDKQLGVYFVTEDELSKENINASKEEINKFIEKVLLYIWDDIAKLDPNLWFNDNINTFDDLVKSYHSNALHVFKGLFPDINNEQLNNINEEN